MTIGREPLTHKLLRPKQPVADEVALAFGLKVARHHRRLLRDRPRVRAEDGVGRVDSRPREAGKRLDAPRLECGGQLGGGGLVEVEVGVLKGEAGAAEIGHRAQELPDQRRRIRPQQDGQAEQERAKVGVSLQLGRRLVAQRGGGEDVLLLARIVAADELLVEVEAGSAIPGAARHVRVPHRRAALGAVEDAKADHAVRVHPVARVHVVEAADAIVVVLDRRVGRWQVGRHLVGRLENGHLFGDARLGHHLEEERLELLDVVRLGEDELARVVGVTAEGTLLAETGPARRARAACRAPGAARRRGRAGSG